MSGFLSRPDLTSRPLYRYNEWREPRYDGAGSSGGDATSQARATVEPAARTSVASRRRSRADSQLAHGCPRDASWPPEVNSSQQIRFVSKETQMETTRNAVPVRQSATDGTPSAPTLQTAAPTWRARRRHGPARVPGRCLAGPGRRWAPDRRIHVARLAGLVLVPGRLRRPAVGVPGWLGHLRSGRDVAAGDRGAVRRRRAHRHGAAVPARPGRRHRHGPHLERPGADELPRGPGRRFDQGHGRADRTDVPGDRDRHRPHAGRRPHPARRGVRAYDDQARHRWRGGGRAGDRGRKRRWHRHLERRRR